MDLHEQLNLAINLATDKHSKQVDKAGDPYILHPLWVMNKVKSLEAKIVAVLHDIVEDTDITIEDLIFKGFDDNIVYAVDILTKRKGMDYENYIDLIGENEIAMEVKMADLEHNMDLSRLKEITDKDRQRLLKYRNAHFYLTYIHYDKIQEEE